MPYYLETRKGISVRVVYVPARTHHHPPLSEAGQAYGPLSQQQRSIAARAGKSQASFEVTNYCFAYHHCNKEIKSKDR